MKRSFVTSAVVVTTVLLSVLAGHGSSDGFAFAQSVPATTAGSDFDAAMTRYLQASEMPFVELKHSYRIGSAGRVGIAGIHSVAFSPDGKKIATLCIMQEVRIWDIASEKELHRQKIPYTGFHSASTIAFSPDGKKVASSHVGVALIWDAETGQELRKIGHVGLISVAFSSDGKKLVTGSGSNYQGVIGDGTARIWDVESGKELQKLRHDVDTDIGGTNITSVAFSPDGKRVVTGNLDGSVRIWDTESGKELLKLGHDSRVDSVAFSLDGKKVVSGGQDAARIWDAETGKELNILRQGTAFRSVAFSPDGKKVAAGNRVWDVNSRTELHKFESHGGEVTAVAFSPDGKRIVSAGFDGTAKIWDWTVIEKQFEDKRTMQAQALQAQVSFAENNPAFPFSADVFLVDAVRAGNIRETKTLIEEHKANVNVKGHLGSTPLHAAARSGSFEIVEYLVSKGANVNAKDDNGYTPLHMAAGWNTLEVIKHLVSSGADVNAKDNSGETPLHCAAIMGNVEQVRFLISQKADKNIRNNDGETPLDRARSMSKREVVDYLSGVR